MQPVEPVLTIDLFPEVRGHLLDLLATLADEDWDRPTACAGWLVKDVALHLLGGDISNISRRRDGFQSPGFAAPGVDLSQWANQVEAINRWNDEWVRVARRMSTPLLRELLDGAGEALEAYFRTLDPMVMGGPVSWAGPAPAPVWLDIAREYTERWLHQQHIRDAVGRPGLRERRYLAPVLATFVHALPEALREVAAPEGTCLRLIITGAAGDAWVATRAADGWALGKDSAAEAEATVALDEETAWRLFTKGMSRAEAERRADLTGDRTLVGAVLDMVSIIA